MTYITIEVHYMKKTST